MRIVTKERLLNVGFCEKVEYGQTIYIRNGLSFICNDFGWCPCTNLVAEVKISNIYTETMEDIEQYIINTKNL